MSTFSLEEWMSSGRNVVIWAAICVATVLTVDGYLAYRVFQNEADRGSQVLVIETVPRKIIERPCPPAKVIIIERGQLDIPIG